MSRPGSLLGIWGRPRACVKSETPPPPSTQTLPPSLLLGSILGTRHKRAAGLALSSLPRESQAPCLPVTQQQVRGCGGWPWRTAHPPGLPGRTRLFPTELAPSQRPSCVGGSSLSSPLPVWGWGRRGGGGGREMPTPFPFPFYVHTIVHQPFAQERFCRLRCKGESRVIDFISLSRVAFRLLNDRGRS